jgi:hypothetical protein
MKWAVQFAMCAPLFGVKEEGYTSNVFAVFRHMLGKSSTVKNLRK